MVLIVNMQLSSCARSFTTEFDPLVSHHLIATKDHGKDRLLKAKVLMTANGSSRMAEEDLVITRDRYMA